MSMEKLKIYLVEDDRKIFSDAFSELHWGNGLTMFSSGADLIVEMESAQEIPHIIFLELLTPEIEGLDILRGIRKHERYDLVALAIYSPASDDISIKDALIAGANIYITKPSDFIMLKDMIRKAVEASRPYIFSERSMDNFVFVL